MRTDLHPWWNFQIMLCALVNSGTIVWWPPLHPVLWITSRYGKSVKADIETTCGKRGRRSTRTQMKYFFLSLKIAASFANSELYLTQCIPEPTLILMTVEVFFLCQEMQHIKNQDGGDLISKYFGASIGRLTLWLHAQLYFVSALNLLYIAMKPMGMRYIY